MGFLFPFFLLAGLFLLLPLVIHLFNLRRYKHEYFPNLRFLRQIQAESRKHRELKKKWLLLCRLLFLTALVIAFAQPYLHLPGKESAGQSIRLIYLDNSFSMSAPNGPQSLLEQAQSKATELIMATPADARFLVLTNDNMSATRPLRRKEALAAVHAAHLTGSSADINRILAAIALAQENERNESWQVYLFSDFQESTLGLSKTFSEKLPRTEFYLLPFQNRNLSNFFIDTAFLLHPITDGVLQNEMIARVKRSGAGRPGSTSLQVAMNGQTRAVKALRAGQDSVWTDTIGLQFSPASWQKLTLTLQADPLDFDDTFRMALRTGAGLSVLVLADGPLNPYLQTAFGSMPGLHLQLQQINAPDTSKWGDYSLIVLQNTDYIPPPAESGLQAALRRGQQILLFPGQSADKRILNRSLQSFGDMELADVDTMTQQVVSLREEHPLIRGLFKAIPENMQLPLATKRFPIYAGISANQQAIMSFRDGTPFLAEYSLEAGKLFLCASPLDDHYSDFPLSYFFVPLLYKMASQDGTSHHFTLTIGSDVPLRINKLANSSGKRGIWHILQPGFDAVAVSQPSGSGVLVFAGKATDRPGFYVLKQEEDADSLFVGMNADPRESVLHYAGPQSLKKALTGYQVHWLQADNTGNRNWSQPHSAFPLWKIAVCIALACLIVETWFLIKSSRLPNAKA